MPNCIDKSWSLFGNKQVEVFCPMLEMWTEENKHGGLVWQKKNWLSISKDQPKRENWPTQQEKIEIEIR